MTDGAFGGGSGQWANAGPDPQRDALPLPPMVPGQGFGQGVPAGQPVGVGQQGWNGYGPQQQAGPYGQSGANQGGYAAGGYGQVPQSMPVTAPAAPPPPGSGQTPLGAPGAAFPVAEVFDGRMPDGRPLIERAALDPREIPALTAYLMQAPVVLQAPGFGADQMVPTNPPTVPRAYHSDGTWIWPAEVGYYLHRYQLPPHPVFLTHIRSRNYQLTQVPQQVRTSAATQLMAQLNATSAPAGAAQPPAAGAGPAPVPAQGGGPILTGVPMPMPTPMPVPVAQNAGQSQPPPPPQTMVLPYPAPGQPASASAAETMLMPALADSSSRPALRPIAITAFSDRFREAGNRNSAWVAEQNDTFDAFTPRHTWTLDPNGRLHTGGAVRAEGLGTLSPQGIWTWAWADQEAWPADSALPTQAARLRTAGEREGIEELTAPVLDLSAVTRTMDAHSALHLLAFVAAGLLGARGVRGMQRPDGGTSYYVVCDTDVPAAQHSLGAALKYLVEGAARFGDHTDAVECAIGYAEHHGWEWNRHAEGIEIVAGGAGRIEVRAAQGRLTGLRLDVYQQN